MHCTKLGNEIALDADGVLLDYHAAYGAAWERAFGIAPAIRDSRAYWPIDRWAVEHLTGTRLAQFQGQFDESFWATIPAIDGAVDACLALVSAGFELICVTALDTTFAAARLHNLRTEGFPIKRVIATESKAHSISPKAAAIAEMRPVAFVDDYLPYHRGIAAIAHCALITREPHGSPNCGPELKIVNSTHKDLRGFAKFWLGRPSIAS